MDQPTPAQWQRIEALFDEAAELPPDRREAHVAAGAGDDVLIRVQVMSLLAAVATGNAVFEHAATGAAVAPAAATVEAGTRIGAFRIVGLLGRGGMGEVYAAARADGQFAQEVALKLVHAGAGVRPEQFDNERRILATLEHPGIAHLIDGGLTTEGRPYMVMELVRGRDILTYCREEQLGLAQRLALFGQICEAVGYAHRHLVVHRDIKPGNILVTAEGQVKLLDFGVAKLLDPLLAGRGGQDTIALMTPEYAAPEQMEGKPVTTATDVFSLGVLLYRLLAGVPPWTLRELPIPAALQRLLEVVPRPLAAAAQANPAAPLPPRLLRGDLEAIAAKALRREPDERYASAIALRSDVQRYLAQEPVLARGGARSYLLRRFLQRYRVLVMASTLVLLSLLAGLVGTLWQAQRATRQAAHAVAVDGFLKSVFAVSDPNVNKGEQVSASQLLDRGAERIEKEFATEPELRADLESTIGNLYSSLGNYARATALLQKSLAVRAVAPGKDSPDYARNLVDLATAEVAMDQYAAAEPQLREALDRSRRLDGAQSPQVLRLLGRVNIRLSHYAEAEPQLREALAIDRKRQPAATEDVADDLDALGQLAHDAGKNKEATELLKQALAGYRTTVGDQNSKSVQAMWDLSEALSDNGDLAQSLTQGQQALETSRKLYGPDHPVTLGIQRDDASLLIGVSRYDEAEPLLNDVLARERAKLGERHSEVAETLNVLMTDYYGREEYVKAQATIREAMDIWRETLGPEDEALVNGYNNLAGTEQHLGKLDDAIRDHRTALELAGRTSGTDKENYIENEIRLAGVLAMKGDGAEAEQLSRDALQKAQRLDGPTHFTTNGAQLALGQSLLAEGQVAAAVAALRDAVATGNIAWAEAPANMDRVLLAYAQALAAHGDLQPALDNADKALQLRIKSFGPDANIVAQVQALRGKILARLGRVDEARASLTRTLEICRLHPQDHLPDLDCAAVKTDLKRLPRPRAAGAQAHTS